MPSSWDGGEAFVTFGWGSVMVWIVGLVINLVAWMYHASLLLATWENRRFARSRLENFVPGVVPWQQVGLIVPCKGAEPGLEDNLACFLQQDYPHYRLTFVVESTEDPAYEIIQRLTRSKNRVSTSVIIAGRAVGCGQKVHNLRIAVASQSDDVNTFAFADSDIRPDKDWLRGLVFGLSKSGRGAVTGYRWFVPARNTLANLLLYSFNSAAAALYGPGGHFLVWGGSWAIRRDYFEQTAIADAWQGTLSDDLVVSRTMRLARLPVVFEPRTMVASHVDTDLIGLNEFVRRQLLIGRRYATRMWLLCFGFLTVSLLAMWGSLAMVGGRWFSGQGISWWLLANGVGLYSMNSLRAWLRQDLTRFYLPAWHDRLTTARQFDTWLSPLAGLLLWGGYAFSCVGNEIVWRGIGYFIAPGGRILLLGRELTDRRAQAEQRQAPDMERRRAA